MNINHLFSIAVLSIGLLVQPAYAQELKVKITPEIGSVDVKHNGKTVTIKRNQDKDHKVEDDFAKTSRNCPPFCIQPMSLAPGVETIGEVEMLAYLKKASSGDNSVLVIDSRTPDWVKRGTIPGSINIPWVELNPERGAAPFDIIDILTEQFDVKEQDGLFDYSGAKTLVMFCNGMWCGQSPANIRTLLDYGYPAHKLKWYRGGMQNWSNLGLTTVKPSQKSN
ncbi:rhodanese-like domain-containing protein [Thiohalophilus thiocyanatoxydans]|uniref:Rhodanese-like domain-containing protein n=1 Tax=Thiohalophilus thiocyanatoxydans TaxID=381308 RepID=A0A4V3H3J3_9GAMM|nr:rhodanese-like domain-containing protein [Thiohalophilus thiocyanatoxydans]TDX99544.1 rhodanese-like domain-containing protein [Thiohalophilus thiocyanatoxydans]